MHPEIPSDPPMKTVQLPRGPMSYVDTGGEGPVIVLVHGLPGSHRDFRWLEPALSAGARVVRMDLPGFGQTPLKTMPGTTLPERGRVIVELLEALDLSGIVLAGHSMGGGVATAAAAQAPERIAGLALIASLGPRAHRARREHDPAPIARLMRVPILGRLMFPLVLKGFRRAGFKEEDRKILIHTLDCVAGTSFEDHRKHLALLNIPTAVIWADDDSFIEPEIFIELGEAVPEGPRLRFEGGGHNIQKSRATEMAEVLTPFAGGLLESA